MCPNMAESFRAWRLFTLKNFLLPRLAKLNLSNKHVSWIILIDVSERHDSVLTPSHFSSSILSQRLSFFLETVRNFSWGRDDDRLGEFSWKVPKGVGWSSNDLVWKNCQKDGFLDRTRRPKVPPTRFLRMLTDATRQFWWQLIDSSSNPADRKFYSF